MVQKNFLSAVQKFQFFCKFFNEQGEKYHHLSFFITPDRG